MALVLAQEAVGQGIDRSMTIHQRTFLYLPFEHAELLAMQAQSIRLFAQLGDEKLTQYAHWHCDLIQRFGRFPGRNAALGRQSSAEEAAWLATDEAKRF